MDAFTILRWATVGLLGGIFCWWGWRIRGRSIERRDRWVILAIAGTQIISWVIYYALWWHIWIGKTFRGLLTWHSPFLLSHVLTSLTSLVVGWIAALLLLWVLRWVFLQRGKGLMLDGKDIALLVVATGIVGWPSFLLMLAATFAFSVVGMVVLVMIKKRRIDDRLIITPFIIPATLAVLIWTDWLLGITRLVKIGF